MRQEWTIVYTWFNGQRRLTATHLVQSKDRAAAEAAEVRYRQKNSIPDYQLVQIIFGNIHAD